jgi:hypothetical protein
VEEVRKSTEQVSSEGRALERGDAGGMQPRVEAGDVGAVAIDGAVAVEAGGSRADLALLAVGTADGGPVRREGVATPRAAADGRPNHVHRAIGHATGYTEQARSQLQRASWNAGGGRG